MHYTLISSFYLPYRTVTLAHDVQTTLHLRTAATVRPIDGDWLYIAVIVKGETFYHCGFAIKSDVCHPKSRSVV
jgi:hypothetical protein